MSHCSSAAVLPLKKILINKRIIKFKQAWVLKSATQLIVIYGTQVDQTLITDLGQIVEFKSSKSVVKLSLSSTAHEDDTELSLTFCSKDSVEKCSSLLKPNTSSYISEKACKVSRSLDVVRAPAKHTAATVSDDQAEHIKAIDHGEEILILEEDPCRYMDGPQNSNHATELKLERSCDTQGKIQMTNHTAENDNELNDNDYSILSSLSSILVSENDGKPSRSGRQTLPEHKIRIETSERKTEMAPSNHPDVDALFDDLASGIPQLVDQSCLMIPASKDLDEPISSLEHIETQPLIGNQKTSHQTPQRKQIRGSISASCAHDDRKQGISACPKSLLPQDGPCKDIPQEELLRRVRTAKKVSKIPLSLENSPQELKDAKSPDHARSDVGPFDMLQTPSKVSCHDAAYRQLSPCHRIAVQKDLSEPMSLGEAADYSDTEGLDTYNYVNPKWLSGQTSPTATEGAGILSPKDHDFSKSTVNLHENGRNPLHAWVKKPSLSLVDDSIARQVKIVRWFVLMTHLASMYF